MSALRFTALPGDEYEVRRAGVLLGAVARVEATKSVIQPNRARLSTVVRWRFQVLGQRPCLSLYVTRQKAADALASQYDAYQRALAKAATP